MEAWVGEAKALLTSAQGAEVLAGARHDVRSQLHDDSAGSLTTDGHIEVDAWEWHFNLNKVKVKGVTVNFEGQLFKDSLKKVRP